MYFSDLSDNDEVGSSTTDTLDGSAETWLEDSFSSPTVEQVLSTLQGAGWDFTMLQDGATIANDEDIPKITHTGSGIAPSWNLVLC